MDNEANNEISDMELEQKIKSYRKQYEACQKSGSEYYRWTAGSVIASIPLSVYVTKNMVPLFALGSLGMVGDWIQQYNHCAKERDQLDQLLLQREKRQIQEEKNLLQLKHQVFTQNDSTSFEDEN